MSEFSLSIAYTVPRKIFVAMSIAWLFVGVLVSLFCVALGPIASIGPKGPGTYTMMVMGLVGFYCWLSARAVSSMLVINRIRVSKEGIAVPFAVAPQFGSFNISQLWGDLQSAHVEWCLSERRPEDALILQFPGRQLRLQLKRMADSDIEQFLLAIEAWGTGCKRTESLTEFQEFLRTERETSGNLSYTRIWESELNRRFRSTTFTPLEPGAKVNRYTVIKQIAFGGFSAIYLAESSTGQVIVLKESVVPESVSADIKEKAMEQFQREATILAELKHPFIAQVKDSFVDADRNYTVLEYVEGTTLRAAIANSGPADEDTILSWANDLAAILKYLSEHAPPIVHRDLTPENLVINDEGRVVAIDFGAANEYLGSATRTVVGKQAYMPPEQVRGKATPKSDVYALGGVLFYALTGQEPEALTSSHPKTLRPEVSQELNDLIARMTDLDEDARPAPDELATLFERMSNYKLSLKEHHSEAMPSTELG